jgi:uncharacterized protein (TIGR02679 family)
VTGSPDSTCRWCGGCCAGIDLTAVRGEHLNWFWRQLADAGDRRGDPNLVTGTASVNAPANPTERAAALGLLGRRIPGSGQTVQVNLARLTTRLQAHHPNLTPGMVAAHVARRSLGEGARDNARRRDTLDQLRQRAVGAFAALPDTAPIRPDMEAVWPVLHRHRWTARLIASENAALLVDQAAAVFAALPTDGERIDRRRLADAVTRFPHALDTGALPGLVLAILVAVGAIPASSPARAAWAAVGVDCDDLTGGLLALGIYPAGWTLPPDATVTLPPRELARCAWPAPPRPHAPVFVTENPSVVTAAADLVAASTGQRRPVRLLCTVGTPSAREIDAAARLAAAGWQVAVRADFDLAGLQHVDSMLTGVPGARPWRMGATDYLDSLASTPADDGVRLDGGTLPATPWDPQLGRVMTERGLAAYEESLIDALLEDLIAE